MVMESSAVRMGLPVTSRSASLPQDFRPTRLRAHAIRGYAPAYVERLRPGRRED